MQLHHSSYSNYTRVNKNYTIWYLYYNVSFVILFNFRAYNIKYIFSLEFIFLFKFYNKAWEASRKKNVIS